MNIDWFQPYESTQYSIGIVYLSVFNLPREIRNKIGNIIVCSVIPGPHEPSNMNSILEPMVEELQQLWSGVDVDTVHGGKKGLEPRSYVIHVIFQRKERLVDLWGTMH